MNSTWPSFANRREFLQQTGTGLGGVALSWLLAQEEARAGGTSSGQSALSPKASHFSGTARSIIYVIMEGGPSQMDTFDPKPKLAELDGTLMVRENIKSVQYSGKRYYVKSPFKFEKRGQCGMDVSELFTEVGGCVDDIAFVRSVYAESDNHPAALFQYNTGLPVQGNPSIGSWMLYGLGTENQNLPAYVVLRDGKPFGGNSSWSNGYLPAEYQGLQFRSGARPVLNLQSPESRREQERGLELIGSLNRQHRDARPQHPDLDARIAAFELAFRMQTEIPETIDLASEPAHVQSAYGLDHDDTKAFGTRGLLARRLVERGVRFVQLWSGGWDSHDDIANGHRKAAARVDKPLAALIRDLKQRGMLNDTLVVWGGEFGRTADTNEGNHNKKTQGRDHNPHAATMWFAGGGTRGGVCVGATDEVGERAAERRCHLRDVHATLLHLAGLDHEKLTFYHGGRNKRLTDIGGSIIDEILA
ncbi:MAG: DUF1501 domain-containing protein [Planctomycetota bacterium]|nr:DUF1501 domain-containing protein [Planctomycetota bacterium]